MLNDNNETFTTNGLGIIETHDSYDQHASMAHDATQSYDYSNDSQQQYQYYYSQSINDQSQQITPQSLENPNQDFESPPTSATPTSAKPSSNTRRGRNTPDIVGPYFKPTVQICSITSLDRSQSYSVRLFPRIDRGFFVADNDWVCYRRNYFAVSASFTCADLVGEKVTFPCLVEVEGRGLRKILGFQIHVIARTSNHTREIDLVQHTAKRDKGPQSMPPPKECEASDVNGGGGTVVSWERVQFKSATANNGKRVSTQSFHVLICEVLGMCEDGYLARVASSESAPLVVRGRAPGHYATGNSIKFSFIGPYMAPKDVSQVQVPLPVTGNEMYFGMPNYYAPYYANMNAQDLTASQMAGQHVNMEAYYDTTTETAREK